MEAKLQYVQGFMIPKVKYLEKKKSNRDNQIIFNILLVFDIVGFRDTEIQIYIIKFLPNAFYKHTTEKQYKNLNENVYCLTDGDRN
jgi:hypothetical protein